MDYFGARVKKLRKQRKLLQEQLARKVRISTSHLSKLESNPAKQPGAEVANKLAHALDVTVEYLLTGKEPRPREDLRKRLRSIILSRITNKNEYRYHMTSILRSLTNFLIEETARALDLGHLDDDPAIREITGAYHQTINSINPSEPDYYEQSELALNRASISILSQYLSSITLTDTFAEITYFESAHEFHPWPQRASWRAIDMPGENIEKNRANLSHKLWPVLTKVPAGDPVDWEDIFQPGWAEWYESVPGIRDDNGFCLVVDGDSMSEKIEHGDTVAVSPNRPVVNGDIAIVRLEDGEITIKYIDFTSSGDIYLRPHNPRHPVRSISAGSYKIIGKVVRIIKKP